MRSRIPLLVVIIALLLLGLLVFFGTLHRIRQLTANLPKVLQTELESRLERKVKVQSVKVVSSRTVLVRGLAIQDRPGFPERTFFYAPRAVIRFSTIDLVLGRASLARSISSIVLVQPRVTIVRNAKKVWNFEDLLRRPPVPPAERFRGLVSIQGGALLVVDHAARTPKTPAENSLRELSGTLNFSPARWFVVEVAGRGSGGRFGEIEAKGRWGVGAPTTHLNLRIRSGNPGYWLDYFSNIRTWDLQGGYFNADVLLHQPRKAGIIARGSAVLRDSSADSPYLAFPVKPFAANIRFTGTNISLNGRGYLKRSPLIVQGRIRGLDPGRLDLRITSDRMDLNTLHAAIKPLPRIPRTRWPRPGSIAATITGRADRPEISAALTTPRGVIYGSAATGVRVNGSYRDGTIGVTRASARAAGGNISLRADIPLHPFRATVTGTAAGINLQALSLPSAPQVRGMADARFTFEYFRGLRSGRVIADVRRGRLGGLAFDGGRINASLTGPGRGAATLSLTEGRSPGLAIETATANIALRGRTLLVRKADVDAYKGTISAQGTTSLDGVLDLRVSARQVDLQALLATLGYRQLTGTADFEGSLTGTLRNPRLVGRVAARDGVIREAQYDSMTGRVIATREALVFEDAVIRRAPAEIVSTGRIIVARRAPPSLELQVRGREVQLPELFGLLGVSLPSRGIARADLQVRGRYPNLRISGEAEIRDGAVGEVAFDLARAEFESRQGRTVITELFARRGGMRLAGRGFVTRDGALQIDFTGENLSLSLLNDTVYPYVVVDGPMTFDGQARGTLRSPTFTGLIVSKQPIVNRRTFESLAAQMLWDGATLTIQDGVLLGSGARHDLAFIRFVPRTAHLDVQAAITSGSISRIIGMLGNSPILGLPQGDNLQQLLGTVPTPFTGVVNASLNVEGRMGDLTGAIAFEAAGVQMGDAAADHADAELTMQRSSLRLSKLTVSAPDVSFSTSARFVEALPTDVAATIMDTGLQPLVHLVRNAPFLPAYDFGKEIVQAANEIPAPAEGRLDASVSLADLQSGPTGTLSIRAEDTSFSGTPLGDLAANARLANGTVFLDELRLTPAEGEAVLSGRLDPEGALSVGGRLAEFPLGVLRPWLEVGSIAGTMDADFTAMGTSENPEVQTSLAIKNLQTEEFSVDSISAERITLSANRLSSDGVVVENRTSRLTLSGAVPFVWEPPFIPADQPMNLQAALTDQDFSIARSLPRLVESSHGKLTGRLSASGTLDEPVLEGELSLADGSLKLRNLENELRKINVSAKFQDSSLLIESFTGESSMGGTFSVGGNVAVKPTELSKSLVTAFLTLDSLRVKIVNFTGREAGKLLFTATGQLVATQTLDSPLVEGQLVVSEASLDIPPEVLPTTVQIPQIPINPQLAVTLNLAKDVTIHRGALTATVVGPVTLAGTAASPVIAGTVQVASGQLRYPGRTLELQRGGTASFLLQPPNPAVIAVDVSAGTRVTAVSPITGRITRYVVTLDVVGPVGDLDIDVRSRPPGLAQLDALTLVFAGASGQALLRGQPIQQVIQEQIGQVLLGFALPGLFQGIEVGGITLGLEAGFDVPLQLAASAALSERFIMSYSRSVTGRLPVDTVSFSYTLSPQLALTLELEGQNSAPRETVYLIEYFRRF